MIDSDQVVLPPILEPELCIDRITLLMQTGPVLGMYERADDEYFTKKKKQIKEFVNRLKFEFASLFEGKQPDRDTGLYLYHFRLKGGFDLQLCPKFAIKTRIKDEGYIQAFASDAEQLHFDEYGYIDEYFDSDYGLRLEFNPSKSDVSQIAPILQYICDMYAQLNPDITFDRLWKITRFDVAVDYPEELNPSLFTILRKRKSGWVGGSEGVETAYFGSRRTFFYWRVYDKKREYLEQQNTVYQGESLWRIELECKKPFSIGEDSHFLCKQFRELDYFYGLSTGDWQLDMVLHYGKCFGMQNAFKMMPKQTRLRYQGLISKLDMDALKHPARIVGWELPKQWRSFYDKFKTLCGRDADPMLYQRNVREDM